MQFLNVKKAGSFDISVCPSKEYYYVDISLTRFDMQTLRSARCVLTHSICAARVTQKSPEKSRGDGGVWGGNRGSLLRTREQWGFPYGGRGAPNVRFAHTIRRASDTGFYSKSKEPFYHNSFIVILNGSFVILPCSGLLLIPNRFPRDLAHNHTHNLRTYYNRP